MKAAVFDAILDAFKQDSCITRSISVSDRDEEDVSELFLTQLADPATRLAKGLRRLVLNAVLHDEAANIIGDIIRKNNRLQYLQVRVSSWCFSELSYSLVPDGRYSEAHVVERVVGTPLPMRTKCAILSVFVPHQKLPDDQSFHLDMLVLTQIFGFAAEPTKSQIVILRLRTTRNVDKQPGHRMSCRHMEPPIQTLLSTWFLDTREARIKEPTASAERGRMTEPAEAWGFLDGRFETLRRQLMLFEMEDTDVPWIKFMSLDMTDDRLKRCREALLLIGAMGTYVDTRVHSVWRSKMQDILWTGISLERLGGQPLMPAFDMSRAFAVDHTQEWEATMELLLGYDDLSESFDQDWSRLCEAARAQGLHVDHPHEIPILLTFTLSNEAYEDVQIKSLQVIRECLRKFQQSAAAVARLHPCRPRFQLEGVQLDARHLLVTPRTIPRLLEVLALDIPIETLYMPTGLSRPKGSSWRNAWASLLFTVFGDPRAKVKTSRPIKTVDAYFTSQYMYRALCSVLVQTTNVHKFVCSGSSHPEHFTWKWLYYALFSKPASVRSVVLNDFDDSNVNPSDMDPLYATYPHSQLLEGSTIDDDIDLGTVLLPKGTVIRFAPFQSNDKTVVKGPNGEVFQIIRKNPASTTIDILVPGYGNGIVDRGSALEKRQRLSNSLESVPATSSAVTNLVVLDCHHSDGVADQVSQLIARVGQSLESLKIAAFDVDEEVIRHVLKTCPNLSHFSPGRITRPAFDLLLDAFERDCAIRSLILFEHHEIDNMAEQVLERVADRTTRLAKRLTRLQVVSSPLPRKAAHHVAEIVRTNNRLQYLYVFVSSQSFTTLNYPPVATGRDGVAHVIERVVGVALPMRAKCALLSVFVPSRLSVHLDRLVLTQIFEFAAEPAQSQIVPVKCAGTEKDEEDMEQ